MVNYFVRKTGNDGLAGTSPATAWATLGKAVGAAGISSGDKLYVGAGVYRETPSFAMTSPTVDTQIIADVTGKFTGDPGYVVITKFTTDDLTIPSAGALISPSGRGFITLDGFVLICFGVGIAGQTGGVSTDWTIKNCVFIQHGTSASCINFTGVVNTPLNLTVQNCRFWMMPSSTNRAVLITLPTSTIVDYDANVRCENLAIYGCNSIIGLTANGSGADSFKGGGITVYGMTLHGGTTGIIANSTFSSTYPVKVYNSAFMGTATGLNANILGQIIEDYNEFWCTTNRTNVDVGANSKNGRAMLVHIGQEVHAGFPLRSFLSPMKESPLLGFGNQAGGPLADINGVPKPSGPALTWANSLPAVGAFEYANHAVKETGTVRTGANAIKLSGPGVQDFNIPVDAVSTTVTIYGQFNASYTGTKPQMKVLNGGECGVADATATMTASSGTWEQISLNFTPTAKGVVTIRLQNNTTDATGAGNAFFDDFAVT